MSYNKSNSIWVEKYRPTNINKVIQQDEIKQLIASKNKLGDLPHLLLFGPPGTGKTTTALAICKHIFLSDSEHINNYTKIMKERVLELNASDERGIKIVREKIKTFAAQALNNYTNIPFFKIIVLDEADVMTNDSQFALRRIMEQFSHITRFILICNYVTKIIPPLSSRCSRYKFNTISLSSMKTIISNILTNENVHFDNSTIDDITQSTFNYSHGDLRKAITMLQRSVYISNINDEALNGKLIDNISGQIPNELIFELYETSIKSNSYLSITKILTHILNQGYSSSGIINDLSSIILNDTNLNDSKKSAIFIKMSDISNLLSNGSGEYIQLLAMCSFINHISNQSISKD
jgi:replication factor C subunit 2/4